MFSLTFENQQPRRKHRGIKPSAENKFNQFLQLSHQPIP